MAKVKIRIDANRFAEIAAKMRPEMQEIKRNSADQVELHAKALAPFQSGDLRDSIHIEEDGNDFAVLVGVFYGHFLEFGTRHAPAHPYMKPARDAVYPSFEDALGRLIK